MKILLTGASSFSGMWIAEKLAAAGHEVVAPLRSAPAAYDGLRGIRAARVAAVAEIVPGISFGDDGFIDLVKGRDFDVLVHHAARVTDYRSLDFDVTGAVADNTHRLRQVLEAMSGRGLKAVVATGSVFENDAGAGNEPREAFSPYGLSKALTYQMIRFWCGRLGIRLGKFMIANPFGPYEEPRFCNYLLKTWVKGDVAGVNTPRYLRDNIHVDLMALAYTDFVETMASSQVDRIYGPMGYVETQGAFAERFAARMRERLGLACGLSLAEQTDFSEPLARVNTCHIDPAALGWSESLAWDGLAAYYREQFGLAAN